MPGEFRKRTLTDTHIVVSYTVDDSNDGLRADQFLKKHHPSKSRNSLQTAIDTGRVVIEGKNLKASTTLHAGDILHFSTSKQIKEPEINREYGVLYEDDDLMVVDKSGNMPVHPAGRFLFNTLLMRLREDHKSWLDEDKGQDFFLIHRIDRETSGILLVGKKKTIAKQLTDHFLQKKDGLGPVKKYHAIVHGNVLDDEFESHQDIGPAENSSVRLKMQAFPEGTNILRPECGIMSAGTEFKTVMRKNGLSLIDCELLSGRQHQIRVHLSHKGYPVVGDKLYGGREDLFIKYLEREVDWKADLNAELGFERHALHSRYLKFFHPTKNEWIEIESKLPQDMQMLLTNGLSEKYLYGQL